jgi:hypothetical protein
LVGLGFELWALCLQNRHSTSSVFCSSYFGDGISWTICLGWSWTLFFLILASQVARITGMVTIARPTFLFLCKSIWWQCFLITVVLCTLNH